MRRMARWLVWFGTGLLAPVVLAPAPAAAQCVRDFSMATCDGTDVAIDELAVVSVVEPCTSYLDDAQVILDAVVHNTSGANRQDIGIFVAKDGGSALTGGFCHHDYLGEPLTISPVYGDSNGNGVPDIRNGPWVDHEPDAMPHDFCGDTSTGTEAIKTLQSEAVPLQIACVDTNGDGHVDVDVCVSWSGGLSNTCRNLSDANPPGSGRCSCGRVEVLPEPGTALALVSGAALLALVGRIRAA